MNNFKSIKAILSEVRTDKKSHFKQTSGFVQHGNTSVMKHCISVAYVSLMIAKKLHIKVDRKALVRGALLHDYFLYDWHEKNVIVRHMFPLTPIPPKCREAWIVCMADKYCSARETMYTVKRYAHNARQLVFG